MSDMERVAILGADSLLAQHLLAALAAHHKETPLKNVSLWGPGDSSDPPPTPGIEQHFEDEGLVKKFSGLANLHDAINGCDTIFNLHEVQDFRVAPHKETMKAHNVKFVRRLVKLCAFAPTPVRLVHQSSIYLQVSSRWPNVYGRESKTELYAKFRGECPFPAYCDTKFLGEALIRSASASSTGNIRAVCARVGPLYGEGDRCSLICDSIRLSKRHPQIPLVGDQSGVIQMTYAGNAAHALLKCAEKLASDDSIRSELVLIADDTPVMNFYDLAIKPLYEDEKEGKGESVFQPKISRRRISFYLFYPVYWVLALLGALSAKALGLRTGLSELPTPAYPHLVFHHWTFFSDFKLRVLFDYTSPVAYPASLKRSMDYYRKLRPDKIGKYSWAP